MSLYLFFNISDLRIMNLLKRLYLVLMVLSAVAQSSDAAAPNAYYSNCENKGGKALLEALHGIIANHTDIGYGALWDLYKESDVYPDGKIWDMYSTKHWNTNQTCGNYSAIGDCYNREHSMPKSWFNDAAPMVSDAFHIYPTDGAVNGQRSNYPFGECANGKYLASKGGVTPLGRLGASTFAGYSGTVFEPDDEYKGDFARTYFYMVACYNDRVANWSSDMLVHNSYPALASWAMNMLLKWHRMDPVSQKERDRNEVVYEHQKNRNPFIDNPDMVEYIWGDKSTEKWSGTASTPVAINQPVNGSSVAVGVSRPGYTIEKALTVLTTNAKTDVAIAVSGAQFTVSPTTISVDLANNGATVTIKYTPTATGKHSATLTIKAGSATSTVTLQGEAVDGLPVGEAERVTDNSFVAVWTYVGDADAQACYSLAVTDDYGLLPGYPMAVKAADGRYIVENLSPDTDYIYSLASQSLVSRYVSVRTAQPVPSIDFLFDGDLYFVAEPGEPSEVAEILISTDNIESDFTVTVLAPFELSVDRSTWSTKITLSPDESRMYMRLNSEVAGTFETPITAVWKTYVSDDAMVQGKVFVTTDFLEDFEAEGSYSTYSAQTYYGTACVWNLNDAGIWANDPVYAGKQALRCGKSGIAKIEMAEDLDSGINDVSFFACRWGSNDAEAHLNIEFSTDGGKSYTTAGSVVLSALDYKEYKVHVGAPSGARLRISQKQGKRFLIDDIAITPNKTGVSDIEAAQHQWDAYSRGGSLFVDIREGNTLPVAIYCIDGTTLYSGTLAEGVHEFASLAPGTVYIVAVANFSRTILVR